MSLSLRSLLVRGSQLSLLLICPSLTMWSQQSVVSPEQTAISLPSLQQRVLLAFSPASVLVSLAELSGTVSRTAGKTAETGNVQFQVGDSGVEQETWTLPSGNRDTSRTAFADGRSCSAKFGTKTEIEDAANCLRPMPWFLPAIALRSVVSGDALAQDVTTSADRQAGLTRLRLTPATGDTTRFKPAMAKEYAAVLAASAADLMIDTQTALPKRLEYRQVLNSDPAAFIQVAVDYSDYRLESGLMFAHRIRRSLQRTQESDIQISSLTLR